MAGIRVVELSEGVAGPCACQMLADLGADVVKVERPEGDWGRSMGSHESSFRALNRNKRNICVDLRQPRGAEVVMRLLKRADVMVSNYRPGVMDRLGFGYDAVHLRASRLIYARITAFGFDGSLAGLPGSDTILQAVSALMSQSGEPTGEPQRVGVPVIDVVAARDTVVGVLACLGARERGRAVTGPVDVSLFGSAAALQYMVWQRYFDDGTVQRRAGNHNAGLAPGGLYRTKDGRHIAVVVLREEHWVKFCAALGFEGLATADHFATNQDRLRHRDELDGLVGRAFMEKDFDEWTRILRAHDVPVAPVTEVSDIMDDPDLADAMPLIEIPAGACGPGARSVGLPIGFAGRHCLVDQIKPPPSRGEHRREVLTELGYAEEEIEELTRSGATPGLA